jgi:hypothetical protein
LTEAKLSLTAVEFHQSVGLKVQQMNWIKADWGREEEEEEEEEGGGADCAGRGLALRSFSRLEAVGLRSKLFRRSGALLTEVFSECPAVAAAAAASS